MSVRPALRLAAFAAVALFLAAPACADDPAAKPDGAHQFDFLIGDWDVSVRPKVSGLAAMIHGAPKLAGSWKGQRAFDGRGIEDELRVVDASGNPVFLTRSLRVYDAAAAQWMIVALDAYRIRPSQATSTREGATLRVDGKGTDGEGKTYLSRTRYLNVSADGFRLQQDRSYDNGASWDEAALVIEATRPAAAP